MVCLASVTVSDGTGRKDKHGKGFNVAVYLDEVDR